MFEVLALLFVWNIIFISSVTAESFKLVTFFIAAQKRIFSEKGTSN